LGRIDVETNQMTANQKKDIVMVDGLVKQKKHSGFSMIDVEVMNILVATIMIKFDQLNAL
jgi:hypothetical protein